MRNSGFSLLVIIISIVLLAPHKAYSQQRNEPFINVGFVTNFEKAPDSPEADKGGSIRLGFFHKGLFGNGRIGFYAGYLWYNEFHPPTVEYEDSGKFLVAGIDYKIISLGNFKCYANLGLGNEWFISTYPYNEKEVETSIKPDFGVLLCYRGLNAYFGWQPSDPHHLNIGIGINIFKAPVSSESLD